LKIFLVEDNSDYRRSLREMLTGIFPVVTFEEFPDGELAFSQVARFSPNLILIDIGLPGENGLEITRRIKAAYPQIPVLILTSNDIDEYREAASQCGADGFLTKDMPFERIAESVGSILKLVPYPKLPG
jgi:DNA-binding NarL/FixJ family response regulator